jgi:hypothetical protein
MAGYAWLEMPLYPSTDVPGIQPIESILGIPAQPWFPDLLQPGRF